MIEKLVLASGNQGKLREFSQLFANKNIQVIPQSEFDTIEAEETGLSFVENAILKARNACKFSGLPALADDSGLEVDALKGAPGIYSARYAADEHGQTSDEANYLKLLDALQGVPTEQRTARFQCVLVYMRHEHDPTPQVFQGHWEGQILAEPSGVEGFGYDPVFLVPSENCSSAELSKDKKNALSHRGQAIQELLKNWRP
ncbi:MAG: RdgB/HAM1 family non-canonical purine NTP pyrophosphatase [Oleispira antarctica]|mgnify:FL=1|uniref:dITP/XTP pyrophosphatase n=1 Tax=Oleispira antarctica RB-8 TaxID=698738 RepID=R4YMD6_OLEAN|nr:RdgB/HAM1 family non-canonical purine NTP pyrophosphatase [Oleispira antarctica]MBQ0793407.1 RdgB/HAM1 family non-canonical purine NTP pyrophosphatase [Oleispira antarctica]CCK74248.1 Nucleoside-triphosphatase [Oleispira antarctica RB-8]|tara:strand:+ start:1685 stop:2287 length:603 start_codon:yes stop_codon:yes gene_type:complete